MKSELVELLQKFQNIYESGEKEKARKLLVHILNNRIDNLNQEEKVEFSNEVIGIAQDWIFEGGDNNAFIFKAYGYVIINQYAKAIKDYDLAIESNPKNAAYYIARGICHSRLEEYEKGIKDFNKALEINPKMINAYINLGLTKAKIGDYHEAIKDYENAIEIDPNSDIAYHNQGVIYSKLGDNKKATEFYEKAIEINPDFVRAIYNKGLNLKKLKEYKKAIETFSDVVKKSENEYLVENASSQISELKDRIKSERLAQIFEIIDKIKGILESDGGNLTHYTGLKTAKLLAIEKSPFRLSEASFLNDTSEGKELYKLIDIPLEFQTMGGELKSEIFSVKPFIGSFVSPDQFDDLTLWRMYGKENNEEAKGCSITIQSYKLLHELNKKIDEDDDIPELDIEFKFYNVAYIDNNENVMIPGESLEKEKRLKKELNNLKKSLSNFSKIPIEITEKLAEITYLFKQAHYQSEKEIRLVISGVGFKKFVNINKETPSVFIELVPVNTIISQLTIGPKVERAEEWASAFHYAFEEYEVDCEIRMSRLPYK